ncbi:hypothetical protein KSP39_PZI021027 [Platanthera zijinensis]|uniref:Uncharacterized protein n=1 Tax=Platanthera zijinensis TaxID=2320716 RepID=A0AAP0AZ38_9ASPA
MEARDASGLRGRTILLADGVYPPPKVVDEGPTQHNFHRRRASPQLAPVCSNEAKK